MKSIAVFAILALAAVGCHSQIPSNPTVLTCPGSNGTAYAPLNQSNPATGTTYKDSAPPAGNYCYIAQSVLGTNTSVPSNTAGPLTTNGTNSVNLSWTVPSTGPTPSGYVLLRAPAITSTLAPPPLGTGTVASVAKPASPTDEQPPVLTAKLEKKGR